MSRIRLLLLVAVPSALDAQPPVHLRSLVERNDSAAMIAEVRRRPGDARDLLGELVAEAGQAQPLQSDSILRVSSRLASAYTAVWADSFPMTNLARINRMSPAQRAAKATADSLRVAGNAASARKDWRLRSAFGEGRSKDHC